MRWFELIPTLLVVNIAALAPFSESDAPAAPFVVSPRFDPWIYDPSNYDGQFRLCAEGPALVCAVAFADDY